MPRRIHPALLVISLVACGAGAVALAYAWWTEPLRAAAAATAGGDSAGALELYRRAEGRLARFALSRQLFADEHALAVRHQLALLYRNQAFDAVVASAASAPPAAAPRFWAGTAMLSRALAEPQAQVRQVWLARAEDQLKQALEAAPDDWDTRVNYEVAARLTAELRRRPARDKDDRLQLLRPQPEQPTSIRRVG